MTQSESPGNCPDLHSSPLFGCSGLSLSERKTVRKLKWVFLFGAIAIVLLWTHESVMAQAESPKPTNQQGTTNLVPPPSASAPPTSTTNTPQSPNSPQTFTPSVVEQKDEPGIHKKKQDENSNQEKSVFQEEREDQQN